MIPNELVQPAKRRKGSSIQEKRHDTAPTCAVPLFVCGFRAALMVIHIARLARSGIYCSSSTGCLCLETSCACVCGGTGA